MKKIEISSVFPYLVFRQISFVEVLAVLNVSSLAATFIFFSTLEDQKVEIN